MGVDSTPISREKQGTQSEALSQLWVFGDSDWEKRFSVLLGMELRMMEGGDGEGSFCGPSLSGE